jgi:hypothetical protein
MRCTHPHYSLWKSTHENVALLRRNFGKAGDSYARRKMGRMFVTNVGAQETPPFSICILQYVAKAYVYSHNTHQSQRTDYPYSRFVTTRLFDKLVDGFVMVLIFLFFHI